MESLENYQIKEDLRQSEEYGEYMEKIGWHTIKLQVTHSISSGQANSKMQIFVKKLGPVSIAKIQRVDLPLPWDEINEILGTNRVFMCKLEPRENYQLSITNYQSILKSYKFKIDSWPLLGTKTSRVNLRPGEEDIFNSFKKDARYILRKFQNSKNKSQICNFGGFYEIWRKSARRKDLWIPGENEYYSLVNNFGAKAFCVTVEDAGCVILMHKNTAFYYYAGSTEGALKNNLPYLVVWEAMKEAKKRGCLVWDFEGIYDHRWPNKKWLGFSHFKKSFGGVEVEYPGCFTKWRRPF